MTDQPTNKPVSPPTARLTSNTGDIYEFTMPSIRLGREDDNQIVIDSRKVSRHHALIFTSGSDFFLRDLSSKNGTWLNGEPVQSDRPLRSGDRLKIAGHEYIFSISRPEDFTETASTFTSAFYSPPVSRAALELDFEAVQVRLNGRLLTPPLSPLEWKLLALLYRQQGKVCSRDLIFDKLYNASDLSDIPLDTALETLVSRLRKRLDMVDPNRLPYIRAVRGMGYRLEL